MAVLFIVLVLVLVLVLVFVTLVSTDKVETIVRKYRIKHFYNKLNKIKKEGAILKEWQDCTFYHIELKDRSENHYLFKLVEVNNYDDETEFDERKRFLNIIKNGKKIFTTYEYFQYW